MNEKCPMCGEHADTQVVFRDCNTDKIKFVAYFCKRCDEAISGAIVHALNARSKEVWGREMTRSE